MCAATGRGRYHFHDGAYVEYVGALPAADVPSVVTALQAECDRLLAAGGESKVCVHEPCAGVR